MLDVRKSFIKKPRDSKIDSTPDPAWGAYDAAQALLWLGGKTLPQTSPLKAFGVLIVTLCQFDRRNVVCTVR